MLAGKIEVEASSLEEAKELAYDLSANNYEEFYVEGSFEINNEMTNEYNDLTKTVTMEFDNYKTSDESYAGGIRRVYKFENGYGASVISHSFSYGGESGLWEIAVLDSMGNLTYNTPITNDVIGNLTTSEVVKVLGDIKNLPNS